MSLVTRSGMGSARGMRRVFVVVAVDLLLDAFPVGLEEPIHASTVVKAVIALIMVLAIGVDEVNKVASFQVTSHGVGFVAIG